MVGRPKLHHALGHDHFGCYEYNKNPVLRINLETVQNINQRKSTKVNGFLKIRNSNFVLSQNQMIFDRNGYLQFTALDNGFQYEFKREASVPTLLLYDEAGREFELIKGRCQPGLTVAIGGVNLKRNTHLQYL